MSTLSQRAIDCCYLHFSRDCVFNTSCVCNGISIELNCERTRFEKRFRIHDKSHSKNHDRPSRAFSDVDLAQLFAVSLYRSIAEVVNLKSIHKMV